jgi:hypothetical protein
LKAPLRNVLQLPGSNSETPIKMVSQNRSTSFNRTVTMPAMQIWYGNKVWSEFAA